jgi:hypothetical protein
LKCSHACFLVIRELYYEGITKVVGKSTCLDLRCCKLILDFDVAMLVEHDMTSLEVA